MPSFSIIIPTRDRPDLVAMAIASVVAQPDPDIEIIVSDNSSTPGTVAATRAAFDWAGPDPRLRYVRPPADLPMPEHWEFASSLARNEYVQFLQDRLVMRPGTIATLNELIARANSPPDVVVFGVSAGLAVDGSFSDPPCSGTAALRQPRDVLEEFASCNNWQSKGLLANNLPRGANSATRRVLLDDLRARHGTIYRPLAPDYTSAFMVLAYAKDILLIDMNLYAAHGNRSNGWEALKDGLGRYATTVSVDPFEGCPVPIDAVFNATIRDYLATARVTARDVPPIEMVGYLSMLWRELQIKEELGSTLDIRAMRRQILDTVRTLSRPDQGRFLANRAIIDRDSSPLMKLRHALARVGLLPKIKRLIAAVRNKPTQRYGDVLEAISLVPLQSIGQAQDRTI